MAEQHPKKKPQAGDPSDLNGKDVNSLLESAQKSLEAVEQELGKDVAGKPASSSAKEAPELSGASDIDATLAELEKEMLSLDNHITSDKFVDSAASVSGEALKNPAAALPENIREVEEAPILSSSVSPAETSKDESISVGGQESATANDQDVDSLLAGLASELEIDDSLVAQAESASKPREIAAEPVVPDRDATVDADDELSSLVEDLASLNMEDNAPQNATSSPTDIDGASVTAPDEEHIDDVLASLADDLAEIEDLAPEPKEAAKTPETNPKEESVAIQEDAEEKTQAVESEIDQLLANAEKDLDLDDATEDTAAKPVEALGQKTPPESKAAEENSSQDSCETEEFEEKISTLAEDPDPDAIPDEPAIEDEVKPEPAVEAPAREKTQVTPPAAISAEFPLPQRLLINTMVAANKPFHFVKPGMKEILGVIAVITCMISMLVAGIILLFM